MRALIVVDSSGSDIAFYSLDKAFEQYIIQRFGILGYSYPAKDSSEGGAGGSEVDMRASLAAFFVPLSTSVDVMSSMKQPPYSISCENKLFLVFKKFNSNMHISVGRIGEDTEQIITRRLIVFHSILAFLYGPAIDRISPEEPEQKAVEWTLVNKVLKVYDRLYRRNPTFLLEALEYFQFDTHQDAYNVCQRALKDVANHQTNGGIRRVIYSTLLVDCKIVLPPKSSKVKPPDVLLMILLATGLFDKEAALQSAVHSDCKVHKDDEKRHSYCDPSQLETPYRTPCSSPLLKELETPQPSCQQPLEQSVDGMDEPEPYSGLKKILNIIGGSSAIETEQLPSQSQLLQGKFIERMVFLQGKAHMLHCLELYPDVVFVMLSEFLNIEFSIIAGDVLRKMGYVLSGTADKSNAQKTFENLDQLIKKLVQLGRQEGQARASDQMKKLTAQVHKCWDGLKFSGFKTHLERLQEGQIDHNNPDSIKIDTQGYYLVDRLIRLFGSIYFSPRQSEYEPAIVTDKLLRHFSDLTRDYASFLLVKGMLAFPVANEIYPGLVHFIFIDRSYGDMKAPFILSEDGPCGIPYVDELTQGKDCSSGCYLKKKVWKMVERVQTFLEQGYVVQCWKDTEFLYTYHAWINIPYADIAGTLRFHQPKVHSEPFNVPGIIGTSFYSSLSRVPHDTKNTGKYSGSIEGGDCFLYELYCIHEATMSIQEVIQHCKSLVKTLWSATQEAQIPFH